MCVVAYLQKYHKHIPCFDFHQFFHDELIRAAMKPAKTQETQECLFYVVLHIMQNADVRRELEKGKTVFTQEFADTLIQFMLSILDDMISRCGSEAFEISTEKNLLPIVLLLNEFCTAFNTSSTKVAPAAPIVPVTDASTPTITPKSAWTSTSSTEEKKEEEAEGKEEEKNDKAKCDTKEETSTEKANKDQSAIFEKIYDVALKR